MTSSLQGFRKRFPTLTTHIDDTAIHALLSAAEECEFSIGDIVIHDNSPSDKLFFIMEGDLGSYIDRNGEKIELGEMKAGDIAGEVSMFGNCPTTATVGAKSDCTLLTISKTDLKRLQTSAPELVSQLLRRLSAILAARLLASDQLLYQQFAEKVDIESEDTASFIRWCTTMYQRMHNHQEM